MEGVGARLGRSSSRYGAATVFTGPVRKWKKKWIHVTPNTPSSDNNNNNNNNKHHHSNGNANTNNTNSNNNNNNNEASHILLYKWTPIRKTHTDDDDNTNDDEEPPRRKMKYIPIALLEEQNNEVETEEAKPVEDDPIAPEADPSSKPDMNDVPMEENQVSESTEKQDHNKSTVGLSLNLNARDDDGDEESEDQPNDG